MLTSICISLLLQSNVREIERINEREISLAVEGRASWHDDYRDSAYIFVGNLDKRLTEGDVIAIFSQYGEVLDINLPRVREGDQREQQRRQSSSTSSVNASSDAKPGDRRGFGFLLYEDQRSTVLAVDNLNGYALLNRTLRVDHVRDYKMPKRRNKDGDLEEIDTPSRNAAPLQQATSTAKSRKVDQDDDEEDDDDLADPMAAYIARSRQSSKNDDKEERRMRKEERKRKRQEREERHSRKRYDEDHRNHKQSSHTSSWKHQ